MKKYIANIFTVSRIILSLPLLFVPLSSVWFYFLYLFCGFTDIIDGTIARKTGEVSIFGARLDTIADFVFMIVCCIKFLPILNIPSWLSMWIIIIALVKAFNVTLVFVRKRKILSIHSVLNKIIGAYLFLLPLTLTFVNPTYSVATVCVLSTVSLVQEVCLVAKGKDVL